MTLKWELKAPALAVAGWGLKHLSPGRGKGDHEAAEPRLFELGTELFGSQPVEGK